MATTRLRGVITAAQGVMVLLLELAMGSLAAAAPLYLPARRQEARRPGQQAVVPSGAAG